MSEKMNKLDLFSVLIVFCCIISLSTTDSAFAYKCKPFEGISGLEFRKLNNAGSLEIRVSCRNLSPTGTPQLLESDLTCRDTDEVDLSPSSDSENSIVLACDSNEYARGLSGHNGKEGTSVTLICCKSQNVTADSSPPCYTLGPVDVFGNVPATRIVSPTPSNKICHNDAMTTLLLTKRGVELKFCSLNLFPKSTSAGEFLENQPVECEKQRHLDTAAVSQKFNSDKNDKNDNSDDNDYFANIKYIQQNEETAPGESYSFQCPDNQAISKLYMKLKPTDDNQNDLTFKFQCQNIVSGQQAAVRKRVTKFTLPLSLTTDIIQCRADEAVCGMISVYENNGRKYALFCCDFSNAVTNASLFPNVQKISTAYTTQSVNYKPTDRLKNLIVRKTSDDVLVSTYFATYVYVLTPKFVDSKKLDENSMHVNDRTNSDVYPPLPFSKLFPELTNDERPNTN